MADDLYKILGVAKTATADEIRSAYRKLAKKHHPDLNPGNKAAEDKFKSISAANELLSDPAKRARYDAGEIDETGAERAPQRSYRDYADGPAGQRYRANGAHGGFGGENFEDLFSSMFSGRAANPNAPARGQDAQYVLTINFLDAINGATNRLTLPDGQTLDVKIPPGTEQDAKLRLRGRGAPGRNGGPAGDALIEINIKPHEFYQRDGQDIRLELPITLTEAVLSGTELRLRGRGVPAAGSRPAGDLYVKLRVLIGTPDAALEDFLRGWKPEPTANPRAAMEAAP
ncbi:MAG: molecular chaperone DnaJ [Acidocella sp. 20-57-95]|nr:MAG: molecular chaperone DnaJ [Acidocella sp. 20-57-95]